MTKKRKVICSNHLPVRPSWAPFCVIALCIDRLGGMPQWLWGVYAPRAVIVVGAQVLVMFNEKDVHLWDDDEAAEAEARRT